jgi:hypothetical protein
LSFAKRTERKEEGHGCHDIDGVEETRSEIDQYDEFLQMFELDMDA